MPNNLNSKHRPRNPSIHDYRRVLIILSTLVFTIYSDHYTKTIATKYLYELEPISIYSDLLVFSYVENSGGFLGIVTALPSYLQFLLLNVCVTLVLLYCLYYLFFKNYQSILHTTTLSLITGGGISNLLDRITNNGAVVDFMQIGIGPVKTGIFNLADMYILGGSFLLGFIFLKNHH